MEAGDIVLIHDQDHPRARILEDYESAEPDYTGKDGVVCREA